MALTKQVTKKSVIMTQPKLYSIIFTLTITDTEGVGFTQDFVCEYHTGDNIANKTAKVIEEMQKAIDKYKSEQQIFKSTALDNAVNTIEGGIILWKE